MSQSLTITLPDDRYEEVENMVETGTATSKSDAVNQLMEKGETVNELEARNNNLEQKLAEANSRNEHVDDLANYIEGEQQLQAEERERRRAPLIQRVKWLVWGYDGEQ